MSIVNLNNIKKKLNKFFNICYICICRSGLNVIIGKLLPSGTGMRCYSEVEVKSEAADAEATDVEEFI